jgi:hypothetical protein
LQTQGGTPSSSPSNLQDPAVAGVCGHAWKPNTQQEFDLQVDLVYSECTDLAIPDASKAMADAERHNLELNIAS